MGLIKGSAAESLEVFVKPWGAWGLEVWGEDKSLTQSYPVQSPLEKGLTESTDQKTWPELGAWKGGQLLLEPVQHLPLPPQSPEQQEEVSVCVREKTGCSLLPGAQPDSLGKF